MSTNFYARIKPSKEAKEALKGAIDIDFYKAIEDLYKEMYGSLEYDYADEMFKGGYVHLGKRSCGWKFLWNPNIAVKHNGHMETIKHSDGSEERAYKVDPSELVYFYPLTKKGIKSFIDNKNVEIYDEYGDKQDKEEFWNMALKWGFEKEDKGWDADGYEKEYPNESRFVCDSELIRVLRSSGYKFTSSTNSDFYSDGLRFSTSTEFC